MNFFRSSLLANPGDLFRLEGYIATKLGLDPSAILVTPAISDHRFKPPTGIRISTNDGMFDLQQLEPNQYATWETGAANYAALYVCANPEVRDAVASNYRLVEAELHDFLSAMD